MLRRQIRSCNKCMVVRSFCRNLLNQKTAKEIRKEFLDYFSKNLDHTLVRSSPVVPINDETVAFVNAGMNQFKGIFLGLFDPPALKVVNSQKCIRVGGKHNDLENVGSDAYHHTFFEMLGNWSFGDYFKEQACEYAWNLLTGPYGIKKDFLYVTYFAGDEKQGLKADLECKEIWKRLGVAEDRIIPFGMQENFWEMGITGPCGPCTEIHVDHTMQATNRSAWVNKGHCDLTELWNIVFIQYQRLPDGSIESLPTHHVDTGMGFERLVALLQGKRSNYDTDIFSPLFQAIEKFSKAPKYEGRFGSADKTGVDTAYRILTDHSRMITVALADGMLPEKNHKLRRVLRKALNVNETVFGKNDLLLELSYHVAENLGDVYPEIQRNLKQVQKIIKFEDELLRNLRETSGKEWQKFVESRPALAMISDYTASGLVRAYKELQLFLSRNSKVNMLPSEMAFKLYDTYGLDQDTIAELAKVESLIFDESAFNREMENAKLRSRHGIEKRRRAIVSKASLDLLEKNGIPKTDDSFKYHYVYNDKEGYQFLPLKAKLTGLIVNGNLVSETPTTAIDESQSIVPATVARNGNIVQVDGILDADSEVGIILDKTPCYAPEGGQIGDEGYIKFKNLLFNIREITKARDYVIHFGNFVLLDSTSAEAELQVGEECLVSIDAKCRSSLMKHHTATHLLNAALRNVFPVIGQRGSHVSRDSLTFKFSAFGENLDSENVVEIERLVNSIVHSDVPVNTKIVNLLQLLAEENLTLVPGEAYPDSKIRVVEIATENFKSKEACCGTHVHRTGILEDFCIVDVKSSGNSSRTIKAAVSSAARLARLAGDNVMRKVSELEQELETDNVHLGLFYAKIRKLQEELLKKPDGMVLPYLVTKECQQRFSKLADAVKLREKGLTNDSITAEIKRVLKASALPFVVHSTVLNPSSNIPLESLPLQEMTKQCSETPVLIIASGYGKVKARCCVPKSVVSENFDAEKWVNTIQRVFEESENPRKERKMARESSKYVCSMKVKKIPSDRLKFLMDKAIFEATKFASLHVKKAKTDSTNK